MIAVNDAYRLAPWAGNIYAADSAWWNVHGEVVRKAAPQAKLWTQQEQNGGKFNNRQGLNIVESCGGTGLRKDKLVRGNNSGYQAINLAYMLHATRVLLLGYDMTGRGTHFFGKHPAPLRGGTNYENFIRWFNDMSPEEYGLEVINCTPGSALTCFPQAELHEALGVSR